MTWRHFVPAVIAVSLVVSLASFHAKTPPATRKLHAAGHFDVADLSFLMPPSSRSIALTSLGGVTPRLTDKLRAALSDFKSRAHHPKVKGDPFDSLIVTGFRFDPCGPSYPADWSLDKCLQPNIRLIAQVFDGTSVTSAALHMVFTLGIHFDPYRPSFDPMVRGEVIQELRGMKARNAAAGIVTDGSHVGIHPAFRADQRDSARSREFTAELKRLIEKHATSANFFVTAVMFTEDLGKTSGKERWVWQKAGANFERTANTELVVTRRNILGVDGPEQTFTADLESRAGAAVVPPSNRGCNALPNSAIAGILKPRTELTAVGAEAQKSIDAELQAAIDVADRMDNPDHGSVPNDDCVSCHVASTASSYALHGERRRRIARSKAFSLDFRDAGLTGGIDDADAEWLRSDGYRVMSMAFFKHRPSISQRVVNETLQAAYILNRKP